MSVGLCVLLGLVIPKLSWDETVVWARGALEQGVASLWCADDRDPVLFLSALSQLIAPARFGLLISRLAGRSPTVAVNHLVMLDHLCRGNLDLAVDDEAVFEPIRVASQSVGMSPPFEQRATPRLWSLNGNVEFPTAVMVDVITAADLARWERCGAQCVIGRRFEPVQR